MDNRSIGVFDSGLGGLTVLNAVMEHIPTESLVYFGDSGRAPYGTKSKETIIKYTLQDIRFLQNQDVKMIVIACNTASACSLEHVKHNFDIPVIEVIQPGAAAAVRATKNGKIGIIGTEATISSGVYEEAVQRIRGDIEIFTKACPMFVSLAESGWWKNDIAVRIAQEYLLPLKEQGIDTLVLGCTHYPLLQDAISQVMGEGVQLVNSAVEVAKVVKEVLAKHDLQRNHQVAPVYRYYTSDSVEKFEALGSSFLGFPIHSAEKIDIEKY